MLGPRATCGVTRDTPPCGPFCVLCSRPHPAVSTIASPVRNSWRSAASGPPVEAEQLRFVSPYENVARCAACPEWSDVVVGVRDSAGNKGGPFHPGCQRPRGPRDLGARHPHSPPTAPDQAAWQAHPCSPPALLVHNGKSGAKTRVQAFRSTWLGLTECGQRPQTWGEPKGLHNATRPCGPEPG